MPRRAMRLTDLRFVNRENLPLLDSRPKGFIAKYRSALGGIKVVFLLLDLGQVAQREAARVAAGNNPLRANTPCRAPSQAHPLACFVRMLDRGQGALSRRVP